MAGMMTEEEKTLMELQDRLLMGQQTMQRLHAQERAAMSRKARTEVALTELSAAPDETRMYKSVGKAYFLSSKPTVVAESKAGITEATTEAESFRTQKGVVERTMKEAETEITELLQSNPALVRQLQGLRTS